MIELSDLCDSQSILINASAQRLYSIVSDVPRMGEMSPECKSCRWDEDAGPVVGSWFTGHNVSPTREWDRRCEVIVAEPGVEFAWMPGGTQEAVVRWGFTFSPEGESCRVEESWRILQMAKFFTEQTEEYLIGMIERTRRGIHQTLSALKEIAESS